MSISEKTKINILYFVFILIGIISVAVLKGLPTSIFLIIFLGFIWSSGQTMLKFLDLIRDRAWSKALIIYMILAIVLGIFLYTQYGNYALLKALAVSTVIVLVGFLYGKIMSRKS